MAQEISDGEVDMFGLPVLPKRGPGRPPHVKTEELSKHVNMLFVCGHSVEAVYKALGISRSVFYDKYRDEIDDRNTVALKYKGRQLVRLHDLAESGNVSAEKALAGMIQAERMKTAGDVFVGKAKKPSKAKKLGKKEQLVHDAGEATKSGEWGSLLKH